MNVGLYLTRRSLSMTAAVFVVLVVVYVCVDTVEIFASFKGRLDTFTVIVYKLPLIAGQMLPVSVTAGLAFAFSSMRLRGEWVGLCCVGISPWRLASRLLLSTALSCVCCAFLLMWAAPAGLRAMDAATGSVEGLASEVTWRVMDKVAVGSRRGGARGVVTAELTDEEGLLWCRYERDTSRCSCWSLKTGWTPMCLGHYDRDALFETRSKMPVRAELDPLRAVASRRGPFELWKEAQVLEDLGLGGAAFRAELALRLATVAACSLVPALLIVLLVTSRLSRATHVMLLAAGLAFIYYGVLVVIWNLVVTQAASFYWGAFGAPGIFLGAATVAAFMRWRRAG